MRNSRRLACEYGISHNEDTYAADRITLHKSYEFLNINAHNWNLLNEQSSDGYVEEALWLPSDTSDELSNSLTKSLDERFRLAPARLDARMTEPEALASS